MGFLDNSTNNIIIDAVLTDTGRKFLSQNNGSFSVVNFALCDDEVDYSIIKQYGRTVGKEKIIKNTPVTEAQTHSNLACKHRLLTFSSPTMIRLPTLDQTLEGNANYLSMTVQSDNTGNQKKVIISQQITNQSTFSPGTIDSLFEVRMQNQFVQIPGQTPIVDSDNIARYQMPSDAGGTSKGGGQLTFNVATRPINQFSLYSTYANAKIVKTFMTVTGWFSGAEKIIEIQILDTTQ